LEEVALLVEAFLAWGTTLGDVLLTLGPAFFAVGVLATDLFGAAAFLGVATLLGGAAAFLVGAAFLGAVLAGVAFLLLFPELWPVSPLKNPPTLLSAFFTPFFTFWTPVETPLLTCLNTPGAFFAIAWAPLAAHASIVG
jgi:hypothetical protein